MSLGTGMTTGGTLLMAKRVLLVSHGVAAED